MNRVFIHNNPRPGPNFESNTNIFREHDMMQKLDMIKFYFLLPFTRDRYFKDYTLAATVALKSLTVDMLLSAQLNGLPTLPALY